MTLLAYRIYAYVAVACLLAGFAWGWHAESTRFAEYRGAVEAVGEAQEKRTQERVEASRKWKEEIDAKYVKTITDLARRNAARADELRRLASRSLLPAVPGTAPGGDAIVCFDRGKLNDELAGVLQRHAERLSGIALEGEGAVAAFRACAAWAMKEWKGE